MGRQGWPLRGGGVRAGCEGASHVNICVSLCGREEKVQSL